MAVSHTGCAVSFLLLVCMGVCLVPAPPAGAWPRGPATSPEGAARREARALTRREILQVIQQRLAQMGIAGWEELSPADLRIQSRVPVYRHDAGLQLQRIGFDPLRGETVFELWTSREPELLPFTVTMRRDPRSLGLAPQPRWKRGEAAEALRNTGRAGGRAASRPSFRAPVWAKPGRPATLVMLSRDMRITTTVVPLQPGVKGQCILVRDASTARLMTAEVVGEGLLRADF